MSTLIDLITIAKLRNIIIILLLVIGGYIIYNFGFKDKPAHEIQTTKPIDSVSIQDPINEQNEAAFEQTITPPFSKSAHPSNSSQPTGGIEMKDNSKNDGINNTGNDNTIIQNNSKVGGNQTNISDADLRGSEIVGGNKYNGSPKDSAK